MTKQCPTCGQEWKKIPPIVVTWKNIWTGNEMMWRTTGELRNAIDLVGFPRLNASDYPMLATVTITAEFQLP